MRRLQKRKQKEKKQLKNDKSSNLQKKLKWNNLYELFLSVWPDFLMRDWPLFGAALLLRSTGILENTISIPLPPGSPSSSPLSRLLGLDRAFQRKLSILLDLGYKCRLRLPLLVCTCFLACHLLSNFVPRVEINVQVVDNQEEEEEVDEDGDDAEVVNDDQDGFQVNVEFGEELEEQQVQGGRVQVEIVGELQLG